MTILILTVGGSHEPICTSIEKIKPDKVYFLCSKDSIKQVIGEGRVLKSSKELDKNDLPNIVTLVRLQQDQYEIRQVDELDDLSDCYKVSYSLIEELHNKYPEARIIVDYTGGTKSMSAGLVASALDDERCEIKIVTGERKDLNKVVDQTQMVVPVGIRTIQLERGIKEARELIKRFDYFGAVNLLESLSERYAEVEVRRKLIKSVNICKAYEAWDRFDHKTALEILENYGEGFSKYIIFLKCICGIVNGHGYEVIEDLILNAERRAIQGRFDDAIARLYRAIEMLAQKRLAKLGIDTSNVDLSKVKDKDLLDQFEKIKDSNGKVKIGLVKAWELLRTLDDRQLAKHYESNKDKITNFLKYRNNSILAHGNEPISKSIYDNQSNFIISFIKVGIEKTLEHEFHGKESRIVLQQFTTDFL